MAHKTIQISCPYCDASVELNQENCYYCGSPLVFSEFNDIYSLPLSAANKYISSYQNALRVNDIPPSLNSSAGMCYLKLKFYDKAVIAFENSIEQNFNNSETYFYTAVALLNGKKAFLAQRKTIDRIEKYIEAAIALEPRGIYYYFLAYIKYDYFERKFLRTNPNYKECLLMSSQHKATDFDKQMLFDILGVEKPNKF